MKKSKADEDYSEEEVEKLRTEGVSLLKVFELSVGNHLETLKQMEGDNGEEI